MATDRLNLNFLLQQLPDIPMAIWWVKRDMRLRDNPALTAACNTGLPVIALFCFEPSVLSAPETSAVHVQAQISALQNLHTNLHHLGIPLLAVHAEVREAIEDMIKIRQVQAIYSTLETGSYITFARDIAFGQWCEKNSVPWIECQGQGVFRKTFANQSKQKKLWNEFMSHAPLPVPRYDAGRMLPKYKLQKFSQHWNGVCTELQKQYPTPLYLAAGESEAHQALGDFLNRRGQYYSGSLSSPHSAFVHGSRLSMFLAWGSLSSRTVFHASELRAKQAEKAREYQWARSIKKFRARLHWRDHFIQRLEDLYTIEFKTMNPVFEQLQQGDNPELLAAWLSGTTGYPLVDASMRCFRETGFLNFRMRAMVASFACHILDISWKTVPYPMARLMADYEPGIHISQVQMQAGMNGWNTIRIYNPGKQLAEQDPDCLFVKKWVPELADISPMEILNHEQVPVSGCLAPIVPYEPNRKRAADALYALRQKGEENGMTAALLQKYGSKMSRTGDGVMSFGKRKIPIAQKPLF